MSINNPSTILLATFRWRLSENIHQCPVVNILWNYHNTKYSIVLIVIYNNELRYYICEAGILLKPTGRYVASILSSNLEIPIKSFNTLSAFEICKTDIGYKVFNQTEKDIILSKLTEERISLPENYWQEVSWGETWDYLDIGKQVGENVPEENTPYVINPEEDIIKITEKSLLESINKNLETLIDLQKQSIPLLESINRRSI